eukprot:CAMPEP_0172169446 /NCGR_PEP_ID=MMETSP1050-20130122/10707_1 /TAXON_ID=233186 /ORGANISM="Cryptomonas curvata, Strain CCAP979/52" /LENGTH=240 /DNA_ID=CAMNT_0012840499 /DNA_START=153 /DNA_END=872 /DNA_ORIENTATION=+
MGFLSSPPALQRNMQQDFVCRKLPLSPSHSFTCQAAIKSASSKFFGFRTTPPLKPGNRESLSTKWTCLNQLNDDDRDDNEWETAHEDYEQIVLLRDTKSDRVIECFVDREIEIDGKKYATLMPADTPVIFAGLELVNGTEQLVPVLEEESIDRLFPTASAVLAEMDLSLSRSAVVLTVEGGMGSDEEDDSDEEVDSDEDEDRETWGRQVAPPRPALRLDQLVDPHAPQDGEEEEEEEEEE